MKKKTGAVIASVVFLGILGIPSAAGMALPQKVFSESENRYLQKKPEFTLEGLQNGSFGTKYEAYLSDQFPGRNAWIGLSVMTERAQLKQDVNGVYFGNDGYLIEKFDHEDIVTEQLEQNLKVLASMTEAVGARYGREHVRVMLLPSASAVLNGKLPPLAAPFDQHRVEEKLRTLAGADVVVGMDQIFGGREQERIFYRTDHHWTAQGAYYGYSAWAKSMGLVPWEQEAFQVEQASDTFLGTIQSKINIPAKPDTIELYFPKDTYSYEILFDGGATSSDSLYSLKALEGKDQYAVYLDGNHALAEIRNHMISGERKGTTLLIVKDSFANSFVPFAVNHFETIYMVDLRYYNGTVRMLLEDYPVTDVLVLYQIPGFAKEASVSKLR